MKRVEGDAPSVELPLDIQATAFQRRVWQELQKIPLGSDAHIHAGGAGAGQAAVRASGGEGLRDESGVDRGAMPPGDSRGWSTGRVSLGSAAQRKTAGKGSGASEFRLRDPIVRLLSAAFAIATVALFMDQLARGVTVQGGSKLPNSKGMRLSRCVSLPLCLWASRA